MTRTLLMFLKRRADLSPARLRAHCEERHVPLCLPGMCGAAPAVRGYVEAGPGAPEAFDVMTEVMLPSRAALDAVPASPATDAVLAAIVADELAFADRAVSRFRAVDEVESVLPG